MEETIIMSEEIDEEEIDVEEENAVIGHFPTGTIAITQNGDTDVTDYETASINVQPLLQSKTISPTTSELQVTPDSGYEALSGVTINAVTNAIDANIQPENIKEGVSILGVSGNIPEPSGENAKINLDGEYSLDSDIGGGCLIREINFSGIEITNYANLCKNCINLTTIKGLNVQTSTNYTIDNLFFNCKSLKTAPEMNLSTMTSIKGVFKNCINLKNVPIYDGSLIRLIRNINGFIYNCPSLTDESLNNVLALCLSTTITNGTLGVVGFSVEQMERCKSLSNWTAIVNAGWTTGY